MMMEATMVCGDVDERLPDYLEDSLDEGARRRVRQHLASCARCSSLVAELESIQVSASALPELKPSRDLWAGIAERIETPVIALGSSDLPFRRQTPRWMIGAIAAGLVFATAGITHVLTRQSMEREIAAAGRNVSGEQAAQVAAVSNPVAVPSAVTPVSVEAAGAAPATVPTVPSVRPARPSPERAAARASAPPTARLVARSTADRTYENEIVRLRAVLRERSAQLDPETVRVIEQSLRVIDEAIEQSRAALQKDPASAFLRDKLDSSLEKKVDLLRTAAMLPART